jgi:hypothetical protein
MHYYTSVRIKYNSISRKLYKRFSIVAVLFLVISASMSSVMAESSVLSRPAEDETANAPDIVDTEEPSMPSWVFVPIYNSQSAPQNALGIWNVSIAGSYITMALKQSGNLIIGQAKFEGDNPWNGVVAGSLSGNVVHLSIAVMQLSVLASTSINGNIQGNSITGSYIMFESNGNAAEGNISAILINRNASSYSPAVTDTQGQAFQKTELVEQQAKSAELETATTQENRFKDVTKLGIDPSILPSMRRLN